MAEVAAAKAMRARRRSARSDGADADARVQAPAARRGTELETVDEVGAGTALGRGHRGLARAGAR